MPTALVERVRAHGWIEATRLIHRALFGGQIAALGYVRLRSSVRTVGRCVLLLRQAGLTLLL